MKANEVNEIINNICEKIGIGINNAKEFIPALAKYKIIHSALWCVLWIVITVLCFSMIKKLIKTYKVSDSWDRPDVAVGIGFLVVISLVLIVTSAGYFIETVEWIASPEVKSIQYVLSMIK